jgi:hypothetical protein
MTWLFKACPACGGNLHNSDDPGWAECLMCARLYRTAVAHERPRPTAAEAGLGRLRRRKASRAPEVLAATERKAA